MKLALLIKSISGGGSEKICRILSNEFENLGTDVTIVVVGGFQDCYIPPVSNRVKIIYLEKSKSIFALRDLFLIFSREKYNSILCFGYELAIIALFVKYTVNLNSLVVLRNVNAISKELVSKSTIYRKYLVVPIVKKFIPRVDLIINQCRDMQDDFIRFTNCDIKKCVTIYNPIELQENFSILSNDVVNNDRSGFFLFVGRLENQKRVDHTIKAFNRYLEISNNKGISLMIYGKGSKELELKFLAESMGISERVIFCGYKPILTREYSAALATLLTSEYEGFPNILLESIAHGTPVISYDCPTGPSEIVIDEFNGYLVENANIERFAYCMHAIEQNPMSRDQIASSSKKYDSKSIAKSYLKHLES